MPVHTAFIIDFLRRHENRPPDFKPVLRGYVPQSGGQVIGNSGVTVSTGLDLGQQTKESLLKMGIPQTVCGVLFPYVGLRRDAAVAKLAALPLILSLDAAEAVDRAVIGSYIREVQERFDRAASAGSKFADRPQEVQAALVSLRYQLGFGGCPKTWDMIASGDYHKAVAELRDPSRWGGRYMERRRDEAALLAKVAR